MADSPKLPLVSCIVPVYNGERFLAETLESALAQSYPAIEVLVVDDGSTDGTAAVADAFADRGVRLIQQANGGSASARNNGCRHATGELLAFLDADDLWRPEKTATQVACFDDNPGLAAVNAYWQNFWDDAVAHEAADNPHLAKPQPGIASTMMLRASAMAKVGPLDDDFVNRDVQDWLMRARLAGFTQQQLQEVLVDRRIHDANMSRQRVQGEGELLDIASRLLAARSGSAQGAS